MPNFSFMMFSRVFMNSMCDTPMFVMTAMFGFATFAMRAISPGMLTPISTTAASSSGVMRRTVMGRPIWLFALPAVFIVLRPAETAKATISFVVVLPTLPVMPITGILKRSR